jgi:hypothetical protein
MKRPTCTAPRPATVADGAGRSVCDGLTAQPIALRLARLVASCRRTDALLAALTAVEYAAIHCRIDADEHAALVELHRRMHHQLLARELRATIAGRSVTMLVRGPSFEA